MISSTGNSHIRAVQALLRDSGERQRRQAFVIEGTRTLREAPAADVRALYLSESYLSQCAPEDRARIDTLPCEPCIVTDAVMRKLSDTQHPQGVLAVMRRAQWTPADLFPEAAPDDPPVPLLLVLEHLQDPGNLGTILRTGEGAGVTGLLLVGRTADLYNPKVVRSTMGSIFRVPHLRLDDIGEAAALLRGHGIRSYAADVRGDAVYDACDYRGAAAFFIGNEGAGLSAEALAAADRRVTIPMAGAVESLNAAVSAAVLTFEAARQRRAQRV